MNESDKLLEGLRKLLKERAAILNSSNLTSINATTNKQSQLKIIDSAIRKMKVKKLTTPPELIQLKLKLIDQIERLNQDIVAKDLAIKDYLNDIKELMVDGRMERDSPNFKIRKILIETLRDLGYKKSI